MGTIETAAARDARDLRERGISLCEDYAVAGTKEDRNAILDDVRALAGEHRRIVGWANCAARRRDSAGDSTGRRRARKLACRFAEKSNAER